MFSKSWKVAATCPSGEGSSGSGFSVKGMVAEEKTGAVASSPSGE